MKSEELPCDHLVKAVSRSTPVEPSAKGCEDCLKAGGEWVHLRLCLACGHVGCCDNSPNRHATKHWKTVGHPVIRSFEPGEAWEYCYADGAYLDETPALRGEAPPVHYARR